MSSWQNVDHSILFTLFFALRKLLKQQSALELKKQTHIHNPIAKKWNELKHNSFILGMLVAGKPSY